jgi:hypothetical protein
MGARTGKARKSPRSSARGTKVPSDFRAAIALCRDCGRAWEMVTLIPREKFKKLNAIFDNLPGQGRWNLLLATLCAACAEHRAIEAERAGLDSAQETSVATEANLVQGPLRRSGGKCAARTAQLKFTLPDDLPF